MPRDVFAAWTTPHLIQRWGPHIVFVEPRKGGKYRHVTHDRAGEHVITGEFREFVPGQRLVMTWEYQGPRSAGQNTQTAITLELQEFGQGLTEVSVREEPIAASDAANAEAAWGSALEALETFLGRRVRRRES